LDNALLLDDAIGSLVCWLEATSSEVPYQRLSPVATSLTSTVVDMLVHERHGASNMHEAATEDDPLPRSPVRSSFHPAIGSHACLQPIQQWVTGFILSTSNRLSNAFSPFSSG
jgi:hypothetical protein